MKTRSEDVESVSTTVLYAKKLAQQMENGENIHIRIVLWSSLSLLLQMKRFSSLAQFKTILCV